MIFKPSWPTAISNAVALSPNFKELVLAVATGRSIDQRRRDQPHNIQIHSAMMHSLFLIQFPSGGELIIILFVVLLLFGGKKIPELMRGLGKGIREFNNARNAVEEELKEGMREVERKKIEEKRAAE